MGADELILRFFAFKNNLDEYVHDIDPFLTDYLERVTDRDAEDALPFDYREEERIFRKTFKVLADTLGTRAFSRWVDNKYAGGFSMAHYEAFSIGLAREIGRVSDAPDDQELAKITKALEAAKAHPELRSLTVGGGKNFRRIYEKKIALVANELRKAYD
jgi:hypothetical protein